MYKVKKALENRKNVRISILGDSAVGKTCIINRYINNEYPPDFLITIGIDKFEKKIELNNGNEIKVILWDTAGSERFRAASLKTISYTDGCIVVFDVTSKESFENISRWIDSIKDIHSDFIIVLFGNKVDCDESEWEVTNEEINEFIQEKKLIYFEVSAKNNIGIDEGIEYIINQFCVEKEYIVIPPRKK